MTRRSQDHGCDLRRLDARPDGDPLAQAEFGRGRRRHVGEYGGRAVERAPHATADDGQIPNGGGPYVAGAALRMRPVQRDGVRRYDGEYVGSVAGRDLRGYEHP